MEEILSLKWVALDNKNILKYYENSLKTVSTSLYSGGLIIQEAFLRLGGLFWGGLILLFFWWGVEGDAKSS